MLLKQNTLLKTYYNEEIKQSYARISFLIIAVSSLIFFIPHLKIDLTTLTYILIFFASGTFFHLFFIKQFPRKYTHSRKLVAIFLDILGTTAFVYYLESYGIIYFPLFLWIIIGNGIRFGPKYLYIAMGAASFGLMIIVLFSSYWYDNIYTICTWALAMIVLPVFYAKLLKRLQDKNEQLEQLLRLTEYQSKHDSLTNLPNRKYFEQELLTAMEKNKKFALFFIDLDGFKNVNDTFGHTVGDIVLQEVALRLKNTVTMDNMVARLGGDEFVVIVNSEVNIKVLASNIITELIKPYDENIQVKSISASIGISYYPDDTKDALLLKKYADMAMYQIKLNGKNNFMKYCDIT